jgi:DNA-binding response OmpR family regulator
MESRSIILIVEDEPTLRRFMVRLLQREGYDVLQAEDGLEALARADERTPDLIVLDLMLPGIDGFEVCRRIRERPDTSRTPVLIVSARASQDSRRKSLEAGADAFILKPYNPRDLIDLIGERLRKSSV